MADTFQIQSIPAIAAIVYTIIDIISTATGNSDKFKRFIPLLAAVLGGTMGLVFYYMAPDMIGTQSLIIAVIIGAASGLTATGTNQAVKLLAKDKSKADDSKTNKN
ncbi:MAG: hypothetical protein PHX51_04345 [Clostridia bacterium]|nr:hypothetical protein [Clostridia bacterium]